MFCGVLGRWLEEQASEVFDDTTQLLIQHRPLARVARLDGADFDFRLDSVGFDHAHRWGILGQMPMAVVVRDGQLQLARDYTSYLTMLGHPAARAFTSGDEAHRWAARQAAIREYWGQLRAAHLQEDAAPSNRSTAAA